MATLSSPGIGSSLDVNSIVSQLMTIEQQPLTALAKQEASYQAKLSAFGTIKSSLTSFQSTMSSLSYLSSFQALKATSSDTTVLTGSASSTAVAGTYTIQTTKLAQAQSLYATGQASATAAIGTGANTIVTFEFGTTTGTVTNGKYDPGAVFLLDANQPTGSATITSSNNSLQGIRDAINNAKLGVTATIVNDGSALPNRLVITDNSTGAIKSMRISVAGDATLHDLLAFDPASTALVDQRLTQSQLAQDAALTVNGIGITSASNNVSGAIQGVSLSLAKIGSSSLSVASDTAAVQASIQSFVTAYNEINSTIAKLTAYDATAKKGAVLQGDFAAVNIQTRIRSTLTTSLTGLTGGLTNLSQIGVSFQKDGTLTLDSTKLQNAIASNFSDIAGLFAVVGKATDSLVSYAGSTSNTQPGTYAVNVTQLGTQGNAVGLAPVVSTTITLGVDDTLDVNIDGVTATITLTAGSYTADTLAAHIQSVINGTTAFSSAGSKVVVSHDVAGVMTITSSRYGSGSTASVTGGTGAANLFGGVPTSTAGVDAAGTINGVAATGSGQYLTGAKGDASEGLIALINGGVIGSRGTVGFSQGYASRLNALATSVLGSTGSLTSRTTGITRSITDISHRRDVLSNRLVDIEKHYRAQFSALDTLISGMTQTGSFLTQQFAAFNRSTTG
jgi:flagellar hook-associated protein 2